MITRKEIVRALGIFALLVFFLSLTVSPSVARTTRAVGVVVNPLTQDPVPPVNSPQGGGPVPGGPGYVVLNGFDFVPFNQTSSYAFEGAMLINDGTVTEDFFAPAHLPQGATINQLVVYFLDNYGLDGIIIYLMQCNLFSTACEIMASMVSSDAIPGIRYSATSSIFYPVIDNSRYSYAVDVALPDSMSIGLNAVRIDFIYSLSLPAVMR